MCVAADTIFAADLSGRYFLLEHGADFFLLVIWILLFCAHSDVRVNHNLEY